MKQKDLALIMVMVFIGAIASLLVSRLFFASPKSRQQTAEIVDLITPEFSAPSAKYFNTDAVNPTKQIEIGNGSNPNPFSKPPQ